MRYLSLFSGIEAASAAWAPLGWTCVGVAEVAPFPCRVLAHRYPDVPNLGSVSEITAEQIAALGPIDLLVGGFPCQDVSIAGKGRGLNHADGTLTRSGLFFDAMRVVRWAAPRWLVVENVPGLYSSNGGDDFRRVVNEMAGTGYATPHGGWRSAGAVAGPDGLVEWRTLDAQWFGVAQRRRRVFLVRDSGAWLDREPVLLEPESLCRNTPSREEARQDDSRAAARRPGIASVAATLTHGYGDKSMQSDVPSEHLIPDVANTLTHRMAKGINTTLDEGQTLVVHGTQDPDTNLDLAHPLAAKNGGIVNAVGVHDAVGFAVNQRREARMTQVAGAISTSTTSTTQVNGVLQDMRVRRLTPLECERLQGFEDGYTDVPDARGKPAADTPRYSALGNAMAVPVMRWIGRRLSRCTTDPEDRRCDLSDWTALSTPPR